MKRILVVDDKAENLYYLQVLLTSHGHEVQCARHGAEALVMARQSLPDLVVSDLLMPVMDGYTLLRHWKADPALARVPFVVYTATYTEASDEQLAYSLGADAFILKPAEPDAFIARIVEVMEATEPGRKPPQQADADEPATLKVYSETLIRKLEEKSMQLEQANASLLRDVAQRKRIEQQLRQSEAMLTMASRLGRLGAWLIDLPGRELTWSDEARAIHEVPPDFVPTVENGIAFYQTDARPVIARAYEDCVRDGTPFDLELQIVTATGRPVWVRAIGEAVRDGTGRILRVQGAIQDITEHKHLEAQVRQSQKMEAVGTLAGGIAHDFNNLLAIIQGNAHLALADLGESHPAGRSITEIRKVTEHGKRLVQQLLTFSRKQVQVRRVQQLRPVVEETVDLLRTSLPPAVELRCALGDELPPVLADATQIQQVVLNLCTNALHAMGAGPGVLSITLSTVPAPAGPRVRLTVGDTGVGMDEATMGRIFNPFFTTKPAGQGTGLGLSVVDGIVRDHGGAIEVDSRPGRGTTFRVDFPASAAAVEPTPGPPPVAARTGHGQRILYLDDNEALVELATEIFERLGYQVDGHTSAERCLAAFKAAPGAYDLAITDLHLQGPSGLDLAAALLALRPDLGVILISGYLSQGLVERARAIGIRHVVDKTSSVEAMAETIHTLLAAQATPGGPAAGA